MQKEIIRSAQVSTPGAPFSPAVTFGDLVFVSGQPGFDKNRQLDKDNFAAQMRQAMINVQTLLEAAGSSWDKALKVTVVITKTDFFAEMNEIYQEFFTSRETYPARITMVAGFGNPDFLVEIECIAHR